MIQNNLGIHIASEFYTDTHALTVGLITQIGNAVDLLILNELRDLRDQTCLVNEERKLGDNNAVLAVRHRFNVCYGTDPDLAASGAVCLIDASGAEDRAAGREIGSLYDLQDLVDRGLTAFIYAVVDDKRYCVDDLADVVRRDVCRHTDRDTGGTVDKEVRNSRRENRGFLLGLIEVGDELYGILVNIREHLHRDLAESGLGVSHSRGAVAVDRTEVSVTVNERIVGRPFLSEIYQRSVDRAVSVRMVFTHCIADDTGTFTMRLIRCIGQLDHRV